jgi:hypothetical protein
MKRKTAPETAYIDKIALKYMKRKKRAIGYREMKRVIGLARSKFRKKRPKSIWGDGGY